MESIRTSTTGYSRKSVQPELRRDYEKKAQPSWKRLGISVKDSLDWKIHDVWISDWRVVVGRHLNRRE